MKKLLALVLALCMLATVPMALAENKEPVTLTIFFDHTWIPTDDFTGIIPEEITKATGVTLDVTFPVDSNQLGVLAASGDLPDLVYTQNMIYRMSDENLCYSIEDLIAQYNVEWDISAKQLGIGRGLSTDGKAYTILNHVSTKADWEGSTAAPMVPSLSYRADLLKKAGLSLENVDDLDGLYEVMLAVKEAYPEKITMNMEQFWNIACFRVLLGMDNYDFLEQEDGSYKHYVKDARWEEIMMFLNKCYRSGFMSTDDDFFVPGSKAISADMYVFSTGCTQNAITSRNVDAKAVEPEAEVYEMVPWSTASYVVSDFGWSGLFITKSCKNPEAAIKFMAWMFTPEAQALTQMGRPGVDYTLDAEGKPIFSDEWKAAMENGTHDKKWNPYFYFGGSEIVEADSRCATHKPEWNAEAYAIIRDRYDNYPWIQAALPSGDSDEKIIWDEYQELLDTYEHKIIMADSEEGAKELIAEFQKYAESIGLSDLEAYMTTQIAALKPMYE